MRIVYIHIIVCQARWLWPVGTLKRGAHMTEPTITCPSCSTEIKLTESLAAPLIRATREEYEAKIAQRDAELSERETDLRAQFDAVDQARRSIDEQVVEKLAAGRAAIAAEEALKAKAAA